MAQQSSPSFGHIILYGWINFFNQVFLLLYKNITRIIRKPWVLIFMIFFPSLMLGILYGLQGTLERRFGDPEKPKLIPFAKCNNKDFEGYSGNCITIAYTGTYLNQQYFDSLRLLARSKGLTMSQTMNDTSLQYDVVYFENKTAVESFNWKNTVHHVSFVLTFENDYRSYSMFPSQENLFFEVGGPSTLVETGGFGFSDYRDNPLGSTTYELVELMQIALIATTQAETNGTPFNDIVMPDIRFNPVYLKEKKSSQPEADLDLFYSIGIPIVIWISLFASQLHLSTQILEDRRKKLKLGLVMMGLNTGAYQVSWLLFSLIISLFYSAIAIGIGHACKFPFFVRCNLFVIFLLYWLSSAALISFTLMTSAIVHHPAGHTALMVTAFLIGLPLFVIGSMIGIWQAFWSFSASSKLWLFNFDFLMGNIVRSIMEVVLQTPEKGLPNPYFAWRNIYDHTTMEFIGVPMKVPSVSESFGGLILCTVLATLVSIYLECVFPREIANPQSFFFFCSPTYWGFNSKSDVSVATVAFRSSKMSDVAADLDPDILAEYNDVMKRVPIDDPTLALAITKLSKTFKKGRKSSAQDTRALDTITLGADAGTVLGIVGHNGAGKTTLISMLCGVVAPSFGDAKVFGHSVSQNMTWIHQIMGVCPQEDVLWPELTPYQHLKLFAILKKIAWKDHERVISDSLNEVGLLHVKDKSAGKLSGGMKRRLSVAIALLGDVKIIVLDEPTAGLDPRNRIEIWNIIETIKKNRVVILTTHSMNEASALSDKIAILALGRLRAIGSPDHLINRFGKGHQISLVCNQQKVDEVKNIMADLMPDSQLEVDTGVRLSYSLASSKSSQLPGLCKYMEDHGGELIEDWGISQTTMEQVFLRLTHGGGNQEGLSNPESLQLNIALENSNQVIGFVAIVPTTTLEEVRSSLQELPDIPSNYVFLLNGAPVTSSQEKTTTAYRSLPVLELRVRDDDDSLEGIVEKRTNKRIEVELDSDEIAPRHKKKSKQDAENEKLRTRVKELEQELNEKNVLLATINTLQEQVKLLQQQLEQAQSK